MGFKKAFVTFSGGIVPSYEVFLAVEALGKENLPGYFLPSKKTVAAQRENVTQLAQNLGIVVHELGIDEIVEAYQQALKEDIHHPTPRTLESLKSRVRGSLLMAFSNQSNALLLNSLNKSEMALGFCTLYGDMCGALGVIADVKKSQNSNLKIVNKSNPPVPM